MRGGLIGEQIGHDTTAREFRDHIRAIADQAHRSGFALADGVLQYAQRLVQIIHHHIAIACADAALDALGVYVHAEERPAVHGGRQRCAPPIPPIPPLTTSLPARSPPKCLRAAAANVS